MSLAFWLGVATLAPVILPQAIHTRRHTVRLPEADGTPRGQWGAGPAQQRLLVIGESTAAGVGVGHHDQGLASQLARELARHSGSTVAWQTLGTNGIRMAALADRIAPMHLPPSDAVFISMGVNDTTGLTSRHRYYQQLNRLTGIILKQLPHARIYLLAVPPMQYFTALPSPLRQMLGWRARQLDQQQRRLAKSQTRLRHLGYPSLNTPALLAEDGYHPGARGYQTMAAALVKQLQGASE